MPVRLPPPEDRHLPGSPLALVVAQVRFEEQPAVEHADLVRALHDRLGGEGGAYPRVNKLLGEGQLVSSGGDVETRQVHGWRLSSDDEEWRLVLMPHFVALETATYTHWAEFSERFDHALDAVLELVSPVTEERLGLRYLDLIVAPDDNPDWRTVVAPDLLGPVGSDVFGDGVLVADTRLVLDLDDGVRGVVRYGNVTADEQHAFRLDYDVYREAGKRFDVGSIREGVNHFHDLHLSLFRASLTKEFMDSLEARQ